MQIYKITNLINNKIYIGQEKRNNSDYFGSGILIKRAIKKYGKENFIKEIIEECLNKQNLNNRETFWIQNLKAYNRDIGYNISTSCFGGDTLSHHPEKIEIGKKISNILSNSEKFKNAMQKRAIDKNYVNPFFNKKHSEITRKKMSENKIKNWEKNKQKCVYCKKISDLRNIKQWHNENCKLNPDFNKNIKRCEHLSKKIKCIYCNMETTKSNILRWHNNNCKMKGKI